MVDHYTKYASFVVVPLAIVVAIAMGKKQPFPEQQEQLLNWHKEHLSAALAGRLWSRRRVEQRGKERMGQYRFYMDGAGTVVGPLPAPRWRRPSRAILCANCHRRRVGSGYFAGRLQQKGQMAAAERCPDLADQSGDVHWLCRAILCQQKTFQSRGGLVSAKHFALRHRSLCVWYYDIVGVARARSVEKKIVRQKTFKIEILQLLKKFFFWQKS